MLLFADDVVLFQVLLERCAVGCEASGMEISSSKSEAMVLSVCPLWFNNDILPTWRISGVGARVDALKNVIDSTLGKFFC